MRGFFSTYSRGIGLLPLLAFLYIVLFPGQGLPQFEEEIFFETEEWVETAAKRLQPIEESPAAVTILTADEIQASGDTKLADVLRRVPGLEVMSLTACEYAIGSRGHNRPLSNGILVLVNGRSVYQDFFGIVLWNVMDFPLEQIERIEVVRGPGSVLYGANALHAVVNIITKTPFDAPRTMVSYTAGPGEQVGTLLFSGQSGQVGHLVSVGWTQYARYADRDDIAAQYPRARAVLVHDLGAKGRITVEGGMEAGDHENFYETLGRIKSFSVDFNVMAKYDRENFYLRAFWKTVDSDRIFVPPGELVFEGMEVAGVPMDVGDWTYENEVENHAADIEAQKIFDLGWGNLLTAGAGYRLNTMDSATTGPYRTQNLYAAYLQHEFRFQSLFHSYLGVRVDHHPLTEFSISPRGSLLVTPVAGHVFRFSAGRSFRNPTFVENYMELTLPISTAPLTITQNENIDPEKLTSFEVGYQTSLLQGHLRFSLSLFYNQLSDLIQPAYPRDPMLYMSGIEITYGNLDEDAGGNPLDAAKEVKGLEAEIRYRPAYWITAFANYSFADAWDNIYDEEDRRTPRHKANAGVTAKLDMGISTTVTAHYVGEAYWPPSIIREPYPEMFHMFVLGETPSYLLLNLRLAYRFLKDRAEVAGFVFNLLDDDHREFPMGEEIDRRFAGSVKITF